MQLKIHIKHCLELYVIEALSCNVNVIRHSVLYVTGQRQVGKVQWGRCPSNKLKE